MRAVCQVPMLSQLKGNDRGPAKSVDALLHYGDYKCPFTRMSRATGSTRMLE